MKIYEQMRRRHPDFFIHNDDNIYADNLITADHSRGQAGRRYNLEEPHDSGDSGRDARGIPG
jgi:phosphodiesterase/alkaline phosphatase D-like protein